MLDRVKTIKDLSNYLGYPVEFIDKIVPANHYIVFKIDKPGTLEKRIIEAPTGILMEILSKLCDGLQRIYSTYKTPVAHGFIRSSLHDPDKRSIFSNATHHLHKKYLLNIDLESFFYQITQKRVGDIFLDSRFFSFNPQTAAFLVNLVVVHGRLPMGSPTSPPLSNFATIDLDRDLFKWSTAQKITYTRFVDDLSFSANFELKSVHFDIITDILKMHQFQPNPQKIKWFGPKDQKIVTGLIIGEKISLPNDYLNELKNVIHNMNGIRTYVKLFPDYRVLEWIKKIDRVIDGKLNYVKAVYGMEHEIYRNLNRLAHNYDAKSSEWQSLSWSYAGYEFFS